MYLTITPQKLGNTYGQSVTDFVNYLDKENLGNSTDQCESFFNHQSDQIPSNRVIEKIDANTAKLKKTEPRFYSITVNPSARELAFIKNNPEALKDYTRKLMEHYAGCFNRDNPITIRDLKYYARVEHQRHYKGFDREVRENAPYRSQIIRLENQIRMVKRGELSADLKQMKKKIALLENQAPHKINGQMIRQGMLKPGYQSHIHIVVSRRDASNSFSLSPGSKYKASQVLLHGKLIKRGFDRDRFYQGAETTFDRLFDYPRNYVETYRSRKTFVKDQSKYFAQIMRLPSVQKQAAFKILEQTGLRVPDLRIPKTKIQLAVKTFNKLKRAMDLGVDSKAMEY
ncbi:DUF5712 family protein [Zhouia spongiae]|uniref:DUF5712 family protein n=1 Tax=Zhouia spongiae TaxID=2202721 RepID=A0ABY3YKG1_9FLAO|nr:MobB family relaxase [Zhouia spongiae]UNY98324.1 DUF5712 family protein [Zhouia spongiae]